MVTIGKNVLGFVIGFLLASVVIVSALNVLSNSVSYDSNSNSEVGAENVADALDELYDYARPKYTLAGIPFYDDYNIRYYDTLASLKNRESAYYKGVFLRVSRIWLSDSNNSYVDSMYILTCVEIDNEYECFKPEKTTEEMTKMANFFGEQNCADGEYGYECSKGDFSCTLGGDSASCEVKNEYYCAGSFYDSWGCSQ